MRRSPRRVAPPGWLLLAALAAVACTGHPDPQDAVREAEEAIERVEAAVRDLPFPAAGGGGAASGRNAARAAPVTSSSW